MRGGETLLFFIFLHFQTNHKQTMQLIKLIEGPGIVPLLNQFPITGNALRHLAEMILRNGPIPTWLAETIATSVSEDNACSFCMMSHAAAAAHLRGYPDVRSYFKAIEDDDNFFTKREAGLISLASEVKDSMQNGGIFVNREAIESIKKEHEITDEELNQIVLIVGAFNLFNLYVETLGGPSELPAEQYTQMGKMMAEHGYTSKVGA